MTLRYRGAVYEISIHNTGGAGHGAVAVELDGASHPPSGGKVRLKLAKDRGTHRILVTLGIGLWSSMPERVTSDCSPESRT
jgi:hypothetical protein